jgi:integrase
MLRHAAATEVRRAYGLEGAQVILGHAHANITEVYAERDADKARDIARKLG